MHTFLQENFVECYWIVDDVVADLFTCLYEVKVCTNEVNVCVIIVQHVRCVGYLYSDNVIHVHLYMEELIKILL